MRHAQPCRLGDMPEMRLPDDAAAGGNEAGSGGMKSAGIRFTGMTPLAGAAAIPELE